MLYDRFIYEKLADSLMSTKLYVSKELIVNDTLQFDRDLKEILFREGDHYQADIENSGLLQELKKMSNLNNEQIRQQIEDRMIRGAF